MTGTLFSSGIYHLGLVGESELNTSTCKKQVVRILIETICRNGGMMEKTLNCAVAS